MCVGTGETDIAALRWLEIMIFRGSKNIEKVIDEIKGD
jgi:hypothetical protein